MDIPQVNEGEDITLLGRNGQRVVTTLNAHLQKNLQDFLKKRNDPISSVVVVEVKTGRILALVQGRSPKRWGSTVHTSLYSGFPAASIFKVVPTAAAIEVVHIDPTIDMSPPDRCSNVNPHGLWLNNFAPGHDGMNLGDAFAHSCNSFFAKLAVQYVGMGLVERFAQKFGWGRIIPADFYIPLSPIDIPIPEASNIQTVGRFGAGFGRVGLSPVHAAWLNLLIANNGRVKPLRITKGDDVSFTSSFNLTPIIEEETTWQMREIMHKTVVSGTARHAFRGRRFNEVRSLVGGKTGSLTSQELKARVTWFAGMMPYQNPEIIVSSVVVADGNKWVIRGADLAAEAFYLWFQENKEGKVKAQKRAQKPSTKAVR
jgi:cell division protein FtsI/penicillin-binding protein 2